MCEYIYNRRIFYLTRIPGAPAAASLRRSRAGRGASSSNGQPRRGVRRARRCPVLGARARDRAARRREEAPPPRAGDVRVRGLPGGRRQQQPPSQLQPQLQGQLRALRRRFAPQLVHRPRPVQQWLQLGRSARYIYTHAESRHDIGCVPSRRTKFFKIIFKNLNIFFEKTNLTVV